MGPAPVATEQVIVFMSSFVHWSGRTLLLRCLALLSCHRLPTRVTTVGPHSTAIYVIAVAESRSD